MLIYGTVRNPGNMHDGAFIVIDTTIRQAAYCYQSSELAELATRHPETAARSVNALFCGLHAAQFEHCARLLQYCHVSGHDANCGYSDPESVVYELPSADLASLAAFCTFRCPWTNAVELATGALPTVPRPPLVSVEFATERVTCGNGCIWDRV